MVTAETALAMPALVVLLGGLLAVLVAVTAQLRCVAAAREGARAAARGEDTAVVQQIAARGAPDGASVQISGGGEVVTVTVTTRLTPWGGRLGQITVTGSATAQREPTDPGAAAATTSIGVGWLTRRLPGRSRRPARRVRRLRDDRGSGTIYVAAGAGLVAAVTAAAAVLGKAHLADGRAEAAADLAALAAAQTLLDLIGDPCARAEEIAARNAATLAGCVVDGETVVVTTTVPVDLGVLGVRNASGKARAGPVPGGHPP